MSGGNEDSDELQALFDSIVAENDLRSAPPPATPSPAPAAAAEAAPDDMVARIGHLPRTLHDSLRELGYDKVLASAADSIPDTRERLAYVAETTEKAATRTLAATEAAKPLQERLGSDAESLAAGWDRVFANQLSVEEFRDLATRTRSFLREVPAHADATGQHLLEIMMAQDFQDLTGQVIKRMTEMTHAVEKQLLQLLIENAPPARREQLAASGLDGPVIGAGSAATVTSQQQVDELLESLGF
jgi:chemotaxis protein CheZ